MTKYNPEYDYRKGWNAVVPTVLRVITEDDNQEQIDRVDAMISDVRKRIGHYTDEED